MIEQNDSKRFSAIARSITEEYQRQIGSTARLWRLEEIIVAKLAALATPESPLSPPAALAAADLAGINKHELCRAFFDLQMKRIHTWKREPLQVELDTLWAASGLSRGQHLDATVDFLAALALQTPAPTALSTRCKDDGYRDAPLGEAMHGWIEAHNALDHTGISDCTVCKRIAEIKSGFALAVDAANSTGGTSATDQAMAPLTVQMLNRALMHARWTGPFDPQKAVDELNAALALTTPAPTVGPKPTDDEAPCPECGCEVRHPRTGLLQCECPAPLPQKRIDGLPESTECGEPYSSSLRTVGPAKPGEQEQGGGR